MELTIDQALQQSIEAHKAGQVQEADRLYTAILKAQPKHPDANHNMGVLAVAVGKVPEALPFFKAALEANPGTAQFWLSYIDALIKLGQRTDAKAMFDQAKNNGAKGDGFNKLEQKLEGVEPSKATISQNQDPPQDQLQPLVNLYSQGQLQKALNEASKLLKQFPNSVSLYNIQGAVNAGLDQFDAAIDCYKKAFALKPDYAGAYNNMGSALKAQGKLEEAIEAYNKALAIKPDLAEAFNNMGNALRMQGKMEESIKAYNKALAIRPDYAEVYNNMGITLRGVIFNKPNSDLQKVIVSILDHKTSARPADISSAAISLLKFEPVLQKVLQRHSKGQLIQFLHETVLSLIELPLLLKLMSVCPLADLELEGVLVVVRSGLLCSISELEGSSEVLRFQSTLALQCFTNEYVYDQTQSEGKALKALETRVSDTLSDGQQPNPQSILCLASYKVLHEYEWCSLLSITSDIEEVFSRLVIEPQKEGHLKPNIPVLEEITDKVSSKVREQYEVSPYPRWVNLGLRPKPATTSEVINEVKLRLFDDKIKDVESPSILIAGCGTGQHSIDTAARFRNSKVLAIDLSLSSLAYAKRKTEELGLQNIEYMQADILDLGKLNRQFDVVESVGVLHHMDRPLDGWRMLTDCLKPGGLMRVGLYSELARQHIVEMREEISQLVNGPSDFAMKTFRSSVINSDKDHHKQILNSPDFYSLSTLRDLLFHVQEHRFTIPQIRDCLNKLGLKFCGFYDKKLIRNFKLNNTGIDDPYDLDKWHAYEESNPRAFAGMYQFWCQRVG